MDIIDVLLNIEGITHKTARKMPVVVKQHPTKEDTFLMEQAVNIWAEFPKTKPSISDYPKSDKPVAVLGAGPSLPEDLKLIPKDCILVSANHHSIRLVKPDIMCFLDPIDQQKGSEYYNTVLNPPCTRISLDEIQHTDYYTVIEFPKELRPPGDSGRFSLWVASMITTGKIYLCGIGLRLQDQPNHFYDHTNYTTWGGPDLKTKIDQWMKFIDYVGKERIEVVSGPLKDHV